MGGTSCAGSVTHVLRQCVTYVLRRFCYLCPRTVQTPPRYHVLMVRISLSSLASALRAWYRSHRNCRFIQKPSELPKYLASRSAVLGVIPLRPFTISLIR